MGLINQLIRSLKETVHDFLGFFSRGKKKQRRYWDDEPIKLHRSWQKAEEAPRSRKKKQIVVTKHQRKLPGLWYFNKILVGFLLLIDLVFSQFLLGSVGSGAQPMFIFFLLQAYANFLFLWKFRKRKEAPD